MKITRSFSQKKQIAQYEPIDFFCSIEVEIDDEALLPTLERHSKECDEFVQNEVKKSLKEYMLKPENVRVCEFCHGTKQILKDGKLVEVPLNKNGLHEDCAKTLYFQSKEK